MKVETSSEKLGETFEVFESFPPNKSEKDSTRSVNPRFPWLDQNLSAKELDKVCEGLSILIARNLNDNLAELGQSLDRVRIGQGQKRVRDIPLEKWLIMFFQKLTQRDKRFKQINKIWLGKYKLDNNMKKIK
eukprot:scaffold27027_cov79-Skeletonema_dohrnii-CCMP3373.AAC.2